MNPLGDNMLDNSLNPLTMDHIDTGTESLRQAGEYVAQIYVIHQDGFVLLSREYKTSCMSIDPQLIGGFLSAMNAFIQSTSTDTVCHWDNNGRHRLVDIGMTCSRWFITATGEYTVAALLQNDSPLIENEMWGTIRDISNRVVDSFEIFRLFSTAEGGAVHLMLDHSEEFGKTVDNILYETVSEHIEQELQFLTGVEIMDHGKL